MLRVEPQRETLIMTNNGILRKFRGGENKERKQEETGAAPNSRKKSMRLSFKTQTRWGIGTSQGSLSSAL